MASDFEPPSIPRDKTRRRSSALNSTGEDGGDCCRICRGEATSDQPLFYPCKCSGSIKYVHQDCLMEWLSHTQKKYCELCKTPFQFTKLYDQSMPENVPWLLFLRQAVIHTFKAVARWARYSLVIFIWLCWLPWTIRQIWRALFWVADGSWLSPHEVEAVVNEYASHVSNASTASMSAALSNTTIAAAAPTSIGFFSTMVAMLGLFDPQILLRTAIRTILQIAIWPTVQGEPIKWESAFLFTPIPRPPSVLSDFHSITSATRYPIFNNAVLDVLEGQMVCLAIIAAFILVFLIREWVINQQPLQNMPEEDQVDNPAPQQAGDQPRPAARRHRRGLRRPINNNNNNELQLENRPNAPAGARPLVAPRRRATENNILFQGQPDIVERPPIPQRAQSLIPALNQLGENARQLGEIGNVDVNSNPAPLDQTPDPPPLQRGVFDHFGTIQRAIEERQTAPGHMNEEGISTTEKQPFVAEPHVTESSAHPEATQTSPLSPSATDPIARLPTPRPFTQDEFTFRSSHIFSEPDLTHGRALEGDSKTHQMSDLDSGDDHPPTSQTSSNDSQEHIAVASAGTNDEGLAAGEEGEGSSDSSPLVVTAEDQQPEEADTFLTRLSRWLWHTEGYVPGEPVQLEAEETEIVADLDDEAPFNPVNRGPHQNAVPLLPPPPPPPLPNPEPNIQQGININDQNAVDEAEDLEGVLELIGLEGPIAGMMQNIIFSVFLITLTLSASVWCPYIWGKITLLFLAHPFSVFIKAPLFILSNVADFVVDIGLLAIGLFGMGLNYITQVIRVATFPLFPKFSKLLTTTLLESMSSNLSAHSGARLEKSISKTLLGFRPDLPTFSLQSHHVLRTLLRHSKSISSRVTLSTVDWLCNTNDNITWKGLFTLPVRVGTIVRHTPRSLQAALTEFREWSAVLQHELRPLSLAKPEEIDYSLFQWSTSEKITCVLLGYVLFAVVGAIYIKVARRVLRLRADEKVPGVLADTLTQAGGVLKVVVIIGIEMIVFPLYCGTMLDLALLSLFEGATLYSRLFFFIKSPFTALFVHWFLGTCYMFHFALFVSMCRKTMRKGVLYFIRDPDDPSFHPVRDVLERPVATQLGKIAFSAFVYGSLLIICLGGVVSSLNRFGDVLPIQWGAGDLMTVIPGDIIFYNFLLPFMLRKIDVSKKISLLFQWWFRACAGGLRLSDFLFGVDNEDEKKTGAFLWHRFKHVLLHGEPRLKHPMVKYIEDLASHRERLLWFESTEGNVDDVLVHQAAGIGANFKIVNLLDDKAQALVDFGEEENMTAIRRRVEEESSKPDSKFRIKQITDMKVESVEKPATRNTPVDSSAGSYVRAPAKDSVRIPKGTKVFLQVDEKNVRLDGKPDPTSGLHKKDDERFSRIYVPNHFRARIMTFIALVWLFVAVAGLLFTIGPLLAGRVIVRRFADQPRINDLYAMTAGLHAFGLCFFITQYTISQWTQHKEKLGNILQHSRDALPLISIFAQRVCGLAYLTVAIGFVVPMALSLLAELYINIPMYTYLIGNEAESTEPTTSNPLISSIMGSDTRPIIHLLQTWAMGLIYFRVVYRVMTTTPHSNTRPAVAIRKITRDGFFKADVKLASRALILPILVTCVALLGLPLLTAQVAIAIRVAHISEADKHRLYRYSYPILLSTLVALYMFRRLRKQVTDWRIKVRDEVYLIGERLHNFQSPDDKKSKNNTHQRRSSKAKGKDKEVIEITAPRPTTPGSPNTSKTSKPLTFQQYFPLDTEDTPGTNEAPNFDAFHDQLTGFEPSSSSSSSRHPRTEQPPEETAPEISAASASASSPSSSHKPTALEAEINEFKTITGLEDLAGADEIGDVSRHVFGTAGAE